MVDRKEKLVSVIVPVHNAEKYLEEAVESVRKQTYTDWELILVENGSADQSLERCLVYEKRDPRIRTICESVRGIAAARNCGMQEARGTRLMFLDSDDYLADPKTIERLVCAMDKEDADIVVCNYARLWGGKILPAMDLQDLTGMEAWKCRIPVSGILFSRNAFLCLGKIIPQRISGTARTPVPGLCICRR